MYEFNDINEKEKINVFVVTDTIENKFSDNAILYKRSDNEVEYNGFHYNIFKIIKNNLSENMILILNTVKLMKKIIINLLKIHLIINMIL